jgi:sugar lactone lactonase YvrE
MIAAERCHLGEGPTYDAATDTAWWFDILGRRLFEAQIESGQVKVHGLARMASALGRIDAARQLLVTEQGLYVRYVADGRMELFAPLEADNPATRSNDARVHPSGTFWLGTMGRKAEPHAGAIYALHQGRLACLFADITIPNAICFSPAGDVGYFADSATNVMHRVPLDAATGLPSGDPVPFVRRRGAGAIDGAVVDADGLIWNARWGGGCVDVYDPTGRHLRSLCVPARQSSCPAFVGRGLSRLLVTSAWEGMDESARAGDPQHGRTFILEAGVHGRGEPDVKL